MSAISINTDFDFGKKEFGLGEFFEFFLQKIENFEDKKFGKLMEKSLNDRNISIIDFKNFLNTKKKKYSKNEMDEFFKDAEYGKEDFSINFSKGIPADAFLQALKMTD